MPTQNVNLTDQQAAFIRDSVKGGDYNNASEVVRDALRLLKDRKDEQEAKLNLLRAELQKGFDARERGDFVELNSEEDIQALSKEIRRRGRARLAKETNAPSPAAE